MLNTVDIVQEAINCYLMDTKNITNCILDYTGVYKTYKTFDYNKIRGDKIEEEYIIVARSKKDAEEVLMKHCLAIDAAMSSDYNENLQTFYDNAYFEVMKEDVTEEEMIQFYIQQEYLINNIVECEDVPLRYDCKYSFVLFYQKNGSSQCVHNYTLNQSSSEDKIRISYEDCWCEKHYSLEEQLEIEEEEKYTNSILELCQSFNAVDIQYLIQKCKEDNNTVLLQKLEIFETIFNKGT